MKYKESSLEENIADINSTAQYCTDPDYTLWHAKTTPWRGRRVVQILKDHFSTKDRILDVGCSQGMTISYTAQVFPKIEGVDIDKQAIKTAKAKLKRLKVKVKVTLYNGKRLPFAKNTFDGLISSEVFEHVDNPHSFIEELHRVLKPRGKLIISAPNKLYPIESEFHLPFLSYLPKKWADLYVRLSKKGNSYDHIDHPTYRRFTSTVGKHFEIKDTTLSMVRNSNKYFLDRERGLSSKIISFFLKKLESFKNSPIRQAVIFIENIILQLTPGWVLVGTPK